MSDQVTGLIAFSIMCVLFASCVGDPDLIDAVVYYLMH